MVVTARRVTFEDLRRILCHRVGQPRHHDADTPTTGNINIAASNPASTQCMASLATVDRDPRAGRTCALA